MTSARLRSSAPIPTLITRWCKIPHLHDSPPAPTCHDDTPLALERDSPHCFGRLAQFPYQVSVAGVPDLDAAVRATADDARGVELERCDAVVVRGETVDRAVGEEGPDAHGAVGATGYEGVSAELQLADK